MARRFPSTQTMGYFYTANTDRDTNQQDTDWFSGSTIRCINFRSKVRTVVAPGKYSDVRKVIFFAGVQAVSVGNLSGLRLGVAPSTTVDSGRSLATGTLALDSVIGGSSDVLRIMDNPAANSNIPYKVFSDDSWQLYATAGADQHSRGDCMMTYVEFDRFDPLHQDFFEDWDTVAAAGEDRYMSFSPILKKDDTTAYGAINIDCSVFGMTVVQAPSPNNRTAQYRIAHAGWNASTDAAATYLSPVNDRWRYNESEWDGLQSINLLLRFIPGITGGAGSRGVSVRVQEFDSGGDSSGVDVYEKVYGTSNLGTAEAFARTDDLRPYLTNGKWYGVSLRIEVGGGSRTGDQRRPTGWWEFVQKGLTKTTCYHDCNTMGARNPKFNFAAATHTAAQQAIDGITAFFDPQWYEDIPSSDILVQKYWTCQRRETLAHTNSIQMRTDTTLDASDGNLSGTGTWRNRAGTASSIGPVHSTVLAAGSADYIESDISGSGSPINLLGVRKVALGLVNPDVWHGSPGDILSPGGFYYTVMVPETEVPELGPVFELDAFNAEGCAATSAGLGEPGMLIITNGSSLPQKYNPIEGTIQDAGIPTPFRDEVPTYFVDDVGGSPDGLGLTDGRYVYRYTFRNCCTGKESDPNPDDIVVNVTADPMGQVTLNFNGVCIPGDPQICEICIYRTVVGGDFPVMAKVGCFRPDETSLFVDDLGDANLDFINNGLSLLNAPMPCVPYVVDFRNRLFGAGDIPLLSPSGTVSAVEGSDIITGDFDVAWDRCLEGKFIQLEGDCRWYEIERVLPQADCGSPPIQQLELVEPYEGTTQTGASYIVAGRPNRLYYSEPFEPECWPVVNFIDVEPGDGDRITGLASNFDRLVVCKRNKTYVLSFRDIPAVEVSVPARVSSDIGCIGPRTFAQVEVGTVWLADRGLALFDGRGVAHVPESAECNDLFTNPDNPRYVRRDHNGRVIDAVGVWYPKREQYLLLLPTVQTERGCNLMLVWDVKERNVTLLEFCQEFQSMVVAKDTEGNERVYLGDTNGFAWIFDVGDTDGVGTPGDTGTVTGTVTSAGVDGFGASYFDDEGATFIAGGLPGLAGLSGFAGLSGAIDGDQLGLAGVCVYLREPGGAWVQRTVFASNGTRIWVTPSWGSDLPAAGWEYMLGPIRFEATFKPTNMQVDDTTKRNWAQWVIHEPEDSASELKVELLQDFTDEDPAAGTIIQPDGSAGDRTFFMDWKLGRQKRPVGRDIYAYLGVRFRNFAPEQPIRIINHVLGVEAQGGK